MKLIILLTVLALASCGDREGWMCITKNKTMFSMNSDGHIGSAGKACSCAEIRAFELKTFGRIDEDALKSDFGC